MRFSKNKLVIVITYDNLEYYKVKFIIGKETQFKIECPY